LNPETKEAAEIRNMVTAPGGDESCELIRKLIGNHKCATVIVDAVDNCIAPKTSDRDFTYVNLIENLLKIMSDPQCRIKVILSSRGNDRIENVLMRLKDQEKAARSSQLDLTNTVHHVSPYTISTNNQPPEDIARLIRSKVQKWTPAEFLPSEDKPEIVAYAKQYVIETVTKKAEIMYEAIGVQCFTILLLTRCVLKSGFCGLSVHSMVSETVKL
jgi:hypothetical protein